MKNMSNFKVKLQNVLSKIKDNKDKIKKVLGIIANVLVWVFVAISLLTTILVFTAQNSEDGVPSLFGKSLITIETGSMEPTYKVGDLVFMTKITDEDDLSELLVGGENGTIITFRTSVDINGDGKIGDINTHRVWSVTEGSLSVVTKGDNNLAPDNEGDNPYTVHYSDIIGICTEDGKIGGVGNVINFLRSSLGFFLCIVLPLILFFLYELYNFITIVVGERAKRAGAGAPVITKETEEEIKRRAIEEYLKAQAAAKEVEKPEEEAKAPEAENAPTVENAPAEEKEGE